MILHVDTNLADWRAKDPDPFFDDLIEKHIEFRKLSGIEQYLAADAEEFDDISSYTDLLNDMATISSGQIEISDISSSSDDNWDFQFFVNGTTVMFSIPESESGWMNKDFVRLVNESLAPFTSKRFRIVYPTGMVNSSEYFDMAFIDNETMAVLAEHEDTLAKMVYEG